MKKEEHHNTKSTIETNRGINQTGKITNILHFDELWKVVVSVFGGLIGLILIVTMLFSPEEETSSPDTTNPSNVDGTTIRTTTPQKPTFQSKEINFEKGKLISKSDFGYKSGQGVWVYTKENHPAALNDYVNWENKDVVLIQATKSTGTTLDLASITQTGENKYEFTINHNYTVLNSDETRRKHLPKWLYDKDDYSEQLAYVDEWYNYSKKIGRDFAIVDKGTVKRDGVFIIKDVNNNVLYDSSAPTPQAPDTYNH